MHFADEIETANKWGNVLKAMGVKAQVLLLHEGGQQGTATPTPGVSDCTGFTGPVVDIVKGLNPEFGLVVSGHTHRFYSCTLPNTAAAPSVVTSAGTNGQLITDIDYTLDKRTGRFAAITAKNVDRRERRLGRQRRLAEGRERRLPEEPRHGRRGRQEDRRQVPHRGRADRQQGGRLHHRRHHPHRDARPASPRWVT